MLASFANISPIEYLEHTAHTLHMSNRDQLVSIAEAQGLASFGTVGQLRKRIADALLVKALSTTDVISTTDVVESGVKKAKTSPSAPTPTTPIKTDKRKEKKEKKEKKKSDVAKVPRVPTEYNLFVKDTTPYVLQCGFKGRDVLVEVARIWRAKKAGTTLMLTEKTEEVDLSMLTDALHKLSPRQLQAALVAHQLSVAGDNDELVSRLALAMLS